MREHKKLVREQVVRREHSAREHSLRSKRGLSKKDSDAREKIDRARVSDSKGGAALRQLAGRVDQSLTRAEAVSVTKEYQTGIWLPGSISQRNLLFDIPSGELPVGSDRLRFPNLHMTPSERVAITGPNGAGKSRLLKHIVDQLNLPEDRLVYIPQEIPAADALDILSQARQQTGDRLGQIMNIVSRLGSRPGRLLESQQPSPGEVRKLLLALGISKEPHMIVLDEPTNHLDLPSIEALESALADCPCGLLLVSHDDRFIDHIGMTKWSVASSRQGLSDLLLDQ